MSRCARNFSESGIYHIMFRGTNKQTIFCSKWDYQKLLEILQNLKENFEFELYAYCLMENHVHLVLKEKELKDISKIMHRLLTKYSRWFNIKYDRTGTLMENRYKSKVVDNDEYFKHLVRYVHQNPVKAHIIDDINDYEWSSYGDYLQPKSRTIVDTDFLFTVLPKKEFVSFHKDEEMDSFELFKSSKADDKDLIYELKNLGISPADRISFLPPSELYDIVEQLNKKFSDRHIVRVTGVSDYKIRQVKRHIQRTRPHCVEG